VFWGRRGSHDEEERNELRRGFELVAVNGMALLRLHCLMDTKSTLFKQTWIILALYKLGFN
jgi:hypothetical protein